MQIVSPGTTQANRLTAKCSTTSAVISSPPEDVLVDQEVCVVDMQLKSAHVEDTEFEN